MIVEVPVVALYDPEPLLLFAQLGALYRMTWLFPEAGIGFHPLSFDCVTLIVKFADGAVMLM